MKLDEIVAWYQKKIGTYDKQQWEKTVEQKILDGFSGVTLKTAKLKTDLIDVDLVRGSTFPKAKPKQSLLTVIRLAILRYFFLPIYAQWWVRETSPNIFALLFVLYMTQMINCAIYSININRYGDASQHMNRNANISEHANVKNNTNNTTEQTVDHIVSLTEILIPMAISILLSLIHSQIVATNIANDAKNKHRRYSSSSHHGNKSRSEQTRVRRRKKLIKIRNQDIIENFKSNSSHTKKSQQHSCVEILKNSYCKSECTLLSLDKSLITEADDQIQTKTPTNDLKQSSSQHFFENHKVAETPNDENSPLKKRNVNWQSPLHNIVSASDKQQQTVSQSPVSVDESTSTTNTNYESALVNNEYKISSQQHSNNSSSNGSSLESTPNKITQIEHSIQEFYDDLISRTAALETTASSMTTSGDTNRITVVCGRTGRSNGDDDGFESLNGKSSSGEDIHSPLPQMGANQTLKLTAKNVLRLRLNANSSSETYDTEPQLVPSFHRKMNVSTGSDADNRFNIDITNNVLESKKLKARPTASSEESDVDDGEVISSPPSALNTSNYNECTTSATEWLGVTTNSEECSYSSELDNSDDYKHADLTEEDNYDVDFTPTTILNPHANDRVSVTIWDHREIKKAQMSVLEISSYITERVESMPETNDYIYIGIGFSLILSCIPSFCRLCEVTIDSDNSNDINYFDLPMILWEKASFSFFTIFRFAFGYSQWERTILMISFIQRLCLTLILFIIFAVAERTFKQRFLYAKLFSHLTSSRRARKSNLPHFRLNKVRNIKTWLSVRSYLKKRGPQRSVDVIVSAAFMVTLLLLSFLSVEWLKDSSNLHTQLNFEALLWSTTIGVFLLRFMTLGNKIHTKYRSVSVLITEQINLYLQIERKPKKKDELMVSNSVLKLAADLLKELESPFKISGFSANPYLFTTIKVVILSALSGVLSEMLGFKLKLHKIKIK